MKLTLIRHGSTILNEQSRYQGWIDPSLSDTGRMEILALKEVLGDRYFDRIVSSDLNRAIESADILFEGRDIEKTEALREISFGDWDGLTYAECLDQGGQLYRSWIDDPESHTPPNGETLSAMRGRVLRLVNELLLSLSDNPNAEVALLTHGGPIRVLLQHFRQTESPVSYISIPSPAQFVCLEVDSSINITTIV